MTIKKQHTTDALAQCSIILQGDSVDCIRQGMGQLNTACDARISTCFSLCCSLQNFQNFGRFWTRNSTRESDFCSFNILPTLLLTLMPALRGSKDVPVAPLFSKVWVVVSFLGHDEHGLGSGGGFIVGPVSLVFLRTPRGRYIWSAVNRRSAAERLAGTRC